MSKTVLNDINAFIKDYAGKDMGEKEWYGIDLEYGYFVLCKYFNVSKTFESTINLFDTSGNLIMGIFVDSIIQVYNGYACQKGVSLCRQARSVFCRNISIKGTGCLLHCVHISFQMNSIHYQNMGQ